MEYLNPDVENQADPGTPRASRKFVGTMLVAMVVTVLGMLLYEESLYLVFPRITVWQFGALTSIFVGIMAALGAVLALRRQETLAWRANTEALERKRLEQLRVILTEHTGQLERTNQELQGQISQLKQAEENLQVSESELRALLAAMTDVFLVLDEQGRYRKIAPTNPALLYKPSVDLIGKTLREVFPSAQADLFLEHIRTVIKTRQTLDIEYCLHIDGKPTWFAAAISPMPNDCVIWVAHEVTQRKQIEEALRASEEKYRELVENIDEIVFATDSQGHLTYVSLAIERTLGYSPTEMIGRSYTEFIYPDDAPSLAERFQAAMAEQLEPYEYRAVTKSGEIRWALGSSRPIAKDNRVNGVQGVIRDISARKAVEERLREEGEISAILARVGQELISSLDTPNIVEHLCRLMVESLGCDSSHTLLLKPDEDAYVMMASHGNTPVQWETLRMLRVLHKAIMPLLSRLGINLAEQIDLTQVPTLSPPVLAAWQQEASSVLCVALQRGEEIIGLQTAGYHSQSRSFTLAQKRLARAIAHLASLALNNAQLLEEAESANRLKTDFLATLSHELRTPLHIIIGYADMLNEGNLGTLTTEQNEAIRQMKQAARGEVELIATMLDVSRIEAGKLPVYIQAVEPQRLLEEIKGEVAYALERSDLDFQWQVATGLETIYTDRTKLKVILKNLVDNAIKFTNLGTVTIDVFPRAQGVVFSVQDTGEGIAPEVLPIIFDMFRQGDSSMTRRHEGVGLGLYIVQRMLKLLGGTIEVESKAGQGSTFRVWIPARQQLGTKEQS